MPMAKQARQIWAEKLGLYKIKLYCIVITLYRMHTKENKKKTFPSQSSCNPLDAILLFPMCKKPRARYQNSEPPNQRNRSRLASRSNCTHHKEIFPPQYHIYIDNTFRACGKDSPDKKNTGKTHLHHN